MAEEIKKEPTPAHLLIVHGGLPLGLSALAAFLSVFTASVGIFDLRGVYKPFVSDRIMPIIYSNGIMVVATGSVLMLWVIYGFAQGCEVGSRFWAMWAGMTSFLLHCQAKLCFDRVYNMFFLFYLLSCAVLVWSLLLFFHRWRPGYLSSRVVPLVERNIAASFCAALAVMMTFMWTATIMDSVMGKTPPDASAEIVMDMALWIPLMIVSAFLVWTRHSLGHFLCPALLIRMAILGCTALLGALVLPVFGGAMAMEGLMLYSLLGPGSLMLSVVILGWLL